MRKIVEASKPALQSKNLASEQSDTTAALKVTKNTNETSTQPTKESVRIDREQQTTTPPPPLDPALITTIHANKGAIETIRGQITELRSDVDHLRRQINHRKRSTLVNNTPPPNPPVATTTTTSPRVETIPERVPKTEANHDNTNSKSYSHHHHHHHHLEPANSTGRSSVCIVL